MSFELKAIGVAHTAFKELNDVPKSAKEALAEGIIEVYEEFTDCLIGLENFKYIFAFSWMHLSRRDILKLTPRYKNSTETLGVFATRAPIRPNPIGLTLLEIQKIEGRMIYVKGIDFLDGTPIIDIKKYDDTLDTPVF